MKSRSKIAIAVSAALLLGVAATVGAHPDGGYGPGWGMGWGSGAMHGYGGMGGGQGYGMGWGSGHMRGYGGTDGGVGPMMGFGGGYGPMMGYGHPGAFDERLDAQKAALRITDQQESAWKTYADQVKQSSDAMQKLFTTMHESTAATTPERRTLHNDVMKQRLAQSEATDAAFKKLYDVLSPEQRTIVDQGPVAAAPGRRGPGGRFR